MYKEARCQTPASHRGLPPPAPVVQGGQAARLQEVADPHERGLRLDAGAALLLLPARPGPHIEQRLADLPGGGVGVSHAVQKTRPLCVLPLRSLLQGVNGGEFSGGQLDEVLVTAAAGDAARVGAEILLEEEDDTGPAHGHHEYHRTLHIK